jgi:parallel beta-helix repeat protein
MGRTQSKVSLKKRWNFASRLRFDRLGAAPLVFEPLEVRQLLTATVASTTPDLTNDPQIAAGMKSLKVAFSQPVLGGSTSTNYDLRAAGVDAVFGTSDDVVVPITPSYSGSTATLSFATLPAANYQLTLFDTITDAQGNKLDGDANGVAGGNYVRDFTITPGAATKLTVTGFPTADTAGVASPITVTMLDAYGNVATGYTGTVHFTSTDTQAGLPANYTFTSTDAGVHTFSATLYTAGSKTITVADVGTGFSNKESGITVAPAALSTLAVTGFPATTAGTSQNYVVTAQDAFGNKISTYTGTVHFTSSDPQATLPADFTFSTSNTGSHTFSATLRTAGLDSITATDTVAGNSGSETNISITPAAAKTLSVAGIPASVATGAANTLTVSALDAYGNVASGYTGTVKFASSDPLATLPANYTFTAANSGVASFTAVALNTAGTQSVTATDTVTSTITGKESGIVVASTAVAGFTVTGYPSTTAGAPQNFMVVAVDKFGNKVTGYTGTVHFTSSDAQATLPANYTFTTADAGDHTFSATFKTAGTQSVTTTDTTSNASGVQTGIAVTPAAAKTLTVGGIPTNVGAGASNTLTVTAFDAYGNVATGYTGTVQFTSSDPAATLPANYTFTPANNGTASFASVALNTAGPRSVTATDLITATITGKESGITVAATAVASFTVTGYPSTTAGTSQNFVVTAVDKFGNLVSGYTGTVHFASSDSQAVVPADYTFTATDGGNHIFSATLKTAGLQSISLADALNGTSGLQSGISVAAAAAKTLSVGGIPASVAAGASSTLTVTALDPYGNVATGYTGTVTFVSSDPVAPAPANYTFTAANNGTAIISVAFVTVGTQSISAADSVTATITGKETGIGVVAGAMTGFVVSGYPATTTGASNNFVVAAVDAYGNKVVNYTGTVHFTSTDPLAVLPADYTFAAADAGDRTFSATFKTAGTQSLTVTDTVQSFAGTESGISVSPLAGATQFVVTGFPSTTTAGVAGSFTVSALDTYGNLVTNYTGTVSFASTDLSAQLPANYTFQASDHGTATFSATLVSAGLRTISVTDTTTGITGKQQNITVTAAAATYFVIDAPTNVTAGTPFNVTVTAKDAYKNIATGYTGTVNLTAPDDDFATLPAAYTFTAADAGVHVFSVTLVAAGSQELDVADTVNPALIGHQGAIIVAAPAFRYASTSNNIYISGPITVTLTQIHEALPTAPLYLVDATNAVWFLKANLILQNGATLQLHGTSIGGDVNTLRLKSDNTGAATDIVEIEAYWGTIDINTTTITSWDEAVNGPDTEYATYGRAYIRARSFLEASTDANGNTVQTAYESTMNILNSDISYLGSHNAEQYGLTWKVEGETPAEVAVGDYSIYDLVHVYGTVENDNIHNNFFAIYTFGAWQMQIINNQTHDDIGYGIDMHDDSRYMDIEDNNSYNNGWHGIIASQRCTNIIIRNNVSHNNAENGIMLHRDCNDGIITGNTTYDNADSGIALFDNFYTVVSNNLDYGNVKYGIRLSVGASYNTITGNQFLNNGSGIRFYEGGDIPSSGPDYVTTNGRPADNTFSNNIVTGNTEYAVLSQDADGNVFTGNTFDATNGPISFTDSTDNQITGNTLPANMVISTVQATPGIVSRTDISAQPSVDVQVDANSSVVFSDSSGELYSGDVSVGATSFTSTGSSLTLTSAQIGTTPVLVTSNPLSVSGNAQPVLVTPKIWAASGAPVREFLASSATTQNATFQVGQLLANQAYSVTKNGQPLTSGVSNSTGVFSFSGTVGTTSADYAIAQTLPVLPAVKAANITWASKTNIITITGAVSATPTQLLPLVPAGTLTQVSSGVWMLNANVVLAQGAELILHGPSIGGDVTQLRMKSANTTGVNSVVYIRAQWGELDINTTSITSWDPAANGGAGGPDTEYATYGRAYIDVRSYLDGTTPRLSSMNINNSNIGYLGSAWGDLEGLAWNVYGSQPNLLSTVTVTGDVTNSTIHDMYAGAFVNGGVGMTFRNNTYTTTAKRAIEFDSSNKVTFTGNTVTGSGGEGIYFTLSSSGNNITNNTVQNSASNGIELYSAANGDVISGNHLLNNAATGVVVIASQGNTIVNNTITANKSGLALSGGSQSNTFSGNTISNATSYGIYLFPGSYSYVIGNGRPSSNSFVSNTITNSTSNAIRVSGADNNDFLNNTLSGTVGNILLDTNSTGDHFSGNAIPTTTVLVSNSTVATTTLVDNQKGIQVQAVGLAAFLFSDPNAGIFKFSTGTIPTTVTDSGSTALVNVADAGKNPITVTIWAFQVGVSDEDPAVLIQTGIFTTGNYNWTTTGSADQNVIYTLGSLVVGHTYQVKKNGVVIGQYMANANGQISFTDVPGATSGVTYSVTA